MPVELLADESVDGHLIRSLRAGGLSVRSIREEKRGIPDRQVLALARELNSVLLTEDSDFGEWVFAYREPSLGVVFLRYRHPERDLMSRTVFDLVRRQDRYLFGKFTTITPKKTRTRSM